MAKLSAVEAARLRMALVDEAKLLQTGAQNTSDAIGAAYPRMLYRRTDEEDRHVVANDKYGQPKEYTIVNSFGGLLCDTIVAESADEAEELFASGWEVSPSAAYGQQSPEAKASSAKDDRIAQLEAQIAAMQGSADEEPVKRGPGRPRKDEQAALAS